MLSCEIATPRDFDREDLPHMHIRVLSKTHILQAHKEFDGTVKNKNCQQKQSHIPYWGKSHDLFFI